MKTKYVVFIIAFIILGVMGLNGQVINDKLIENYRWENRLLLVFAPSIQNEQFEQIYSTIQKHQEAAEERHLKTIYLIQTGQSSVDGDNINQETAEAIRKKFVVSDGNVTAILIGKDGGEKLRQRNDFDIQEVFNRIDQMPMRKAEMEEQQKNDH